MENPKKEYFSLATAFQDDPVSVEEKIMGYQNTFTVHIGGTELLVGEDKKQALQYRIWNLGPSSKKLHKGKIWDFRTKLGLFWDHFYTLLGLLVIIFIKMPQNFQKAKKAL